MPAYRLLSEFLPEVLPEVPGCPDIMARNEVRKAAIEFCERTSAWRYECDPMQIDAGVHDYELDIPDDTVVHKILRLEYDGTKLEPMTPEQLDRERAGWRTTSGTPFTFYRTDMRRTVRLAYTPDAALAEGLVVWVALRPTRDAGQVTDAFYEEHADTVAAGALAALMGMAGKPWTNAKKAEANLSRFNTKIAKYSAETAGADADAPTRVVPYYSLG